MKLIDSMPNTNAAKKDLRQSAKRTERNDRVREQMRYAMKMVRKSVDSGDATSAKTWLLNAQKVLAKAAQKNVIKKNTAARYTSRLAKRVNNLAKKK